MNAPEYAEDNRPLTNYGARRIVWLVVFLIVGWFILRSLHSMLLLFVVVFLTAMVLNPTVVCLSASSQAEPLQARTRSRSHHPRRVRLLTSA